MLGNLNFITFFIVLVKPINPLTHSFKKSHTSTTGRRAKIVFYGVSDDADRNDLT